MFKQFSDWKVFKKSDDRQMFRQEDIISTNSISSHFQPLYFAVLVEIRVEELDCTITENRDSKCGKTSQEVTNEEKFYINDRSHLSDIQEERFNWLECLGVYGNVDHFLVKELWLKFSWGDGCALLASSGFEELSLSIAKVENGALMENSKDKNPGYGSAKGKCYLVVKQCFLKLQRPWCLCDTSDDMEVHKMVVGFELKKLHLTDGASESLVNRSLARATSATSLSIDITMSKDFESISVISKVCKVPVSYFQVCKKSCGKQGNQFLCSRF